MHEKKINRLGDSITFQIDYCFQGFKSSKCLANW